MTSFTRSVLALVGFALLLLSSCGEPAASTTPEFFADLVGDWSGTQRMLGSEESYDATYKVRLTDSGVLVHDFNSNWQGAFTGREELRFDPADGKLHATWSDTQDPSESSTTGSYDAATRTLTMIGTGPDWENPEQTITFKHVTVYSDGKSSYTMYLIREDGVETAAMWIDINKVN